MKSRPHLVPGGVFGKLLAAWDILLDYPIPERWRPLVRPGRGPGETMFTAWAMVVLGFLYGWLLVVAAWFCGQIFAPTGAAVIFALLTVVAIDGKDSFRGLWQLAAVADAAVKKQPVFDLLPDLDADPNRLQGVIPAVTIVLIELFKLLVGFLLYRHGMVWFYPALFVLDFTFQATLAALPDDRTGVPLLELPGNGAALLWIPAAVLLLLVALKAVTPVVLATVAALVVIGVFRTFCRLNYGGVNASLITLGGAALELLLLLVALLAV